MRPPASETVRRFFDTSGQFGDVMKAANVPPAFVIIQRINLGLMAILGDLRATAHFRRIADELWPWVDGPPATHVPRRIPGVPSLPKTSMGKVLRK